MFCDGGMTLGVGAGQMSRARLGAHRQHQGRERRPVAGRLGGRERRLLPVPRRARRGGRRRRDLRDPAGRLDARRRGDRRRRRARHRDGVHRRAPLPPLSSPSVAAAPRAPPGGPAPTVKLPEVAGLALAFLARLITGAQGHWYGSPAEGRAAHLLRQPPEPFRLGADLGRAAARPARADPADRGARLLDGDAAQALDHARDLQRGLRQPQRARTARRRRGPAGAADRGAAPRRLAGDLSRRHARQQGRAAAVQGGPVSPGRSRSPTCS